MLCHTLDRVQNALVVLCVLFVIIFFTGVFIHDDKMASLLMKIGGYGLLAAFVAGIMGAKGSKCSKVAPSTTQT